MLATLAGGLLRGLWSEEQGSQDPREPKIVKVLVHRCEARYIFGQPKPGDAETNFLPKGCVTIRLQNIYILYMLMGGRIPHTYSLSI